MTCPADVQGREREVWERVEGALMGGNSADPELMRMYCRAAVDEEIARAEYREAIEGADREGARTFGTIARDMRAQQEALRRSIRAGIR